MNRYREIAKTYKNAPSLWHVKCADRMFEKDERAKLLDEAEISALHVLKTEAHARVRKAGLTT